MKKKQEIRIKKQSARNEQECWGMLELARTMHKDAVIIDATRQDDGRVKFSSYTYAGETLLQQRAKVLVGQPNIYDLIVVQSGGTLVTVLTDEEGTPAWVKEHGVRVPVAG